MKLLPQVELNILTEAELAVVKDRAYKAGFEAARSRILVIENNGAVNALVANRRALLDSLQRVRMTGANPNSTGFALQAHNLKKILNDIARVLGGAPINIFERL